MLRLRFQPEDLLSLLTASSVDRIRGACSRVVPPAGFWRINVCSFWRFAGSHACRIQFYSLIWQQSLKAQQFESSERSRIGTTKRELSHQERKSLQSLVIQSQFVSRKAIIMAYRELMEATIQIISTKTSSSSLKAEVWLSFFWKFFFREFIAVNIAFEHLCWEVSWV